LRAFTRISDAPIRRHDSVTEPDLVVVLEPSLAYDPAVREGVTAHCIVLANGDEPSEPGGETRWIPATRLAHGGSGFVNLVMLGAAAAALGEPPLEAVQAAAVETLDGKVAANDVREAVARGYACQS